MCRRRFWLRRGWREGRRVGREAHQGVRPWLLAKQATPARAGAVPCHVPERASAPESVWARKPLLGGQERLTADPVAAIT